MLQADTSTQLLFQLFHDSAFPFDSAGERPGGTARRFSTYSLNIAFWPSHFFRSDSVSLFFIQGSAASTLLFVWAVQCSPRAAFRQGSAAFSLLFGSAAPFVAAAGRAALRARARRHGATGQLGPAEQRHLPLGATDALSPG